VTCRSYSIIRMKMKTVKVKKKDLDSHECVECGAGPDDMDYRMNDKGQFIFMCWECEIEYIVEVIKDEQREVEKV